MTHEELTESAASYALGVLDDDERREFEAHLSGCAECRAEVQNQRDTLGLLALSAPPVRPRDSAALRARILEQTRVVRPIARPIVGLTAARKAPARRFNWTPWAAAACFILAGALALLYQRESNELSRVRRQLANVRAQLADRDSALAAFIGPEVHVVSLAAGTAKPAVRVFWNHTRNVFLVTAHELAPAPAGKTYQLWAISKGKAPASMGTFEPDAQGQAAVLLPVGANIVENGFIDDCALTVEPAGGSPQPTETPRLIGTWRHVD